MAESGARGLPRCCSWAERLCYLALAHFDNAHAAFAAAMAILKCKARREFRISLDGAIAQCSCPSAARVAEMVGNFVGVHAYTSRASPISDEEKPLAV